MWRFLFLLVSCLCLTSAAAAAVPDIDARAALLMDAATGRILYEKNSRVPCPPASTTKVLTAIIAIESGLWDDEVTISARAAGTGGSSLHLRSGQRFTLGELVTGMLLRSGNDAAVAIAEHLSGSAENFALLMNHKAVLLGASGSHFVNAHGLTAQGHYSTALDLAIITRYALANPRFAALTATRESAIDWLDSSGQLQQRQLRNTNKLLWLLPEADGVKTGTTALAGPCLIASATFGRQRLISVVLHDHARWEDSLRLLHYGSRSWRLYEYASAGDLLARLPVEGGQLPLLDAVAGSDACLALPAAELSSLKTVTVLPEKIKAPVEQGQIIGSISFVLHDQTVHSASILAGQSVAARPPLTGWQQGLIALCRSLSAWHIL